VIAIISLDDLNVWFQTCEQQITLFQFVMPMVMKSLTITQHWYALCYAMIQGNGHQLWICRFKLEIIYTCNKHHQLCWMWLWDKLVKL